MKFNPDIKVFGDISYRSKKPPTEACEQVTFLNELRRLHPEIGKIATHIRNEGKRTYQQVAKQKAEGMIPGASDIIIPGSPSLCIELKKSDHTKSKWQPGQQEYLLAAQANGSFACVALGYKGALLAVDWWLNETK